MEQAPNSRPAHPDKQRATRLAIVTALRAARKAAKTLLAA
jgi:hypothetical protein